MCKIGDCVKILKGFSLGRQEVSVGDLGTITKFHDKGFVEITPEKGIPFSIYVGPKKEFLESFYSVVSLV